MLQDAIGHTHTPVSASEAKIISLVPSLTELLFALGLGEQVIGRTGFCIHPQPAVAKVAKIGGTKDVNIEKIRRLAPSHLLVNIDENEKPTVEKLAEFVPNIIVTHPQTARDNLALYQLLGDIFNVQAAAAQLIQAFEHAYAELHNLSHLPAKKVLYCIWKEPWMTVAPETYLANMLGLIQWQVWQVNGDARRYPSFVWDDPALEQVDLILLSSEPYRFTPDHVKELAQQTGKPVQLVDGEMLSWFGSRAIAGLGYLQQLALRQDR